MSSAAKKAEAAPRKFPIPWGLFIVLAVYAAGVYGYIWSQYWNSPEYKAAQAYAKALLILGTDDGRRCSEADLNRAFELTMQAALLMPDEVQLVEHLENLRHRYEERKFKLNKDWINRVEMMSAHTLRLEQAKKGWMVVSQRDKGWAPEQLLAGPERIVLWSLPGGVLIIAFWGYTRFSARRVREDDHLADQKSLEREVEDLGKWREGLGSKRPAPQPGEDDSDTLASSPPVRVQPPSRGSGVKQVQHPSTPGARPPTRGSGVKAVSRPPSLTSRPAVKKRPPDDE